jgi:hypothetical protein
MNHTAYKVTTARNAYGDFTASGETALICHVRIITDIITDSNNETVNSDATMWFEPDSGVVKQDIIKYNGVHYRVERITEARRLRDPSVQFLKCDLLKYGVIS